MKKIAFFPFILLAALGFTLKGQSSLGIDTSNYSIPTTVSYNATYTFSVNVKNYGPQPFSGSLDITYAVDSSSTFPSYDTMSVPHMVTMNIPVGIEQPDTNSIVIDSKFKSGINTVVIWPRNNANNSTHDSLKVSILVTGILNGITNYTESKPLIFPNPMQNRLFVANKDPNFVIEQVRILDISGRIVYMEKFKGSIDVSKLTSGTYTLEFSDKEGKASRYKVIKE